MKIDHVPGLKAFFSTPILMYVRRRLMIAGIVLVGISIIAFSTTYLLPSDPVTSRFPEISESERLAIRARMGLDQPLPIQYVRYLQSVWKGEFGFSYNTGKPVIDDLRTRFPASLELTFFALMFAMLVGIPLGILSAVKRNQWPDHIARVISIGSLSMPAFWVGVVFIYLFFYVLHWAPAPIGRLPLVITPPPTITGFLTIDSIAAGNWKAFAGALRSLALPSIVLGLSIVAPISRVTRSSMSEALQEDYITFARSIGVSEREVVLRDAFRGAQVAVLTMIGYIISYLVAGAALVETVFAWPGIGRYAVDAIVTSDMAPINTVLLFVAIGVALVNLLVDLGYAAIDPRIRHGFAGENNRRSPGV